MNNVETLYKQSSLSRAAYSVFTEGMAERAYITALQQQGKGMSESQAKKFASEWSVVEQFNGALGVRVTGSRSRIGTQATPIASSSFEPQTA
jgi:hypothetical protein